MITTTKEKYKNQITCCSDFSKSQLLSKSFLNAGVNHIFNRLNNDIKLYIHLKDGYRENAKQIF